MAALSPEHFLLLPRPDYFASPAGIVDTTTLAAHDFDVDNRTGFMPPQPSLELLPEEWASWEDVLTKAVGRKLKLGEKTDLSDADRACSAMWRAEVRRVSGFYDRRLSSEYA